MLARFRKIATVFASVPHFLRIVENEVVPAEAF
jgi:hypothetical protein